MLLGNLNINWQWLGERKALLFTNNENGKF